MIQELEKNPENYEFIRRFLEMPPYEIYISKTHWKQLGYFVNGIMVGSILFSNMTESSHIRYTVVLEKYRGAAINKELVQVVLSHAEQQGFNRVTTNIRQSNLASLRSFLGCGFLIYRADKQYKDGELKISLVKCL
jgi:RimJ/RimL family protein N-acetyltransferase